VGNSNRLVGLHLFFAFSILALTGCNKPSAPPSVEFEPLESPLSVAYPKCADLSGTYRLTPDSRESSVFSPYTTPAQQMDLVQIRHTTNALFSYSLKMHKARFVEQMSALRSSNPEGYAKWRALITRWQKERLVKLDTSVTSREILQIGPLPERSGTLAPTLCEAFWGTVEHRYGAPVGLDQAVENEGAIQTETLLSRSKKGALLFRYDNYRTQNGVFGGTVPARIINSAYAKLERMQDSLFDWEVDNETAPPSPPGFGQDARAETELADAQQTAQTSSDAVAQRPANLAAVLVDVQQFALGQLPAGASMSHFVLDESSPNTALLISMKGEAKNNKEVTGLLHALMQHAQVENVELVNVQRSKPGRVEFEIQLKLKNQMQ